MNVVTSRVLVHGARVLIISSWQNIVYWDIRISKCIITESRKSFRNSQSLIRKKKWLPSNFLTGIF
jgi:hypothetical protein